MSNPLYNHHFGRQMIFSISTPPPPPLGSPFWVCGGGGGGWVKTSLRIVGAVRGFGPGC